MMGTMLAAEISFELELAIESGERAALLMLAAMLLSFGFIRLSTRLMRSPKVPWWPGSVTSGDLHIHHLVFGIVLMLIAGFLGFAFQPDSPGIEVAAVAFGIGAGLTLDEFALWLHLEDVYWAEEGRRSVDAVVVAAVFAGLAVTASPFENGGEGSLVFIALVVFRLAVCTIALIKGKYLVGPMGLFLPIVGEVAAIRLARPDSIWARRRYRDDGRKMARARERDERWSRRRDHWRDLIGGAPSKPSPGSRSSGP
jgi:hypothetical protein